MHDISYINWLLMVRAGLTGLEFYTPDTGAWRQAHMHARYVILRVLLEAGEGLVELRKIEVRVGNAWKMCGRGTHERNCWEQGVLLTVFIRRFNQHS